MFIYPVGILPKKGLPFKAERKRLGDNESIERASKICSTFGRPCVMSLDLKSKGNLSHSAKEEIRKTIKPTGRRQIFHPKKPYLDCASTISTVLELLDNHSK